MQYSQSVLDFSTARNAAQLTIAAAAEFLDISTEEVERLEKGIVIPTYQQTVALNFMVSMAAAKPKALSSLSTDGLPSLGIDRKESLAQYFTPPAIATFMVNMFDEPQGEIKLLDAGAGVGALSIAFFKRWGTLTSISGEAHEFDPDTCLELSGTLSSDFLKHHKFKIVEGDFIEFATSAIQARKPRRFTHAILNPPYKKISASSKHRTMLSSVGLETVNLYSGFVAMALALAADTAEIVAIIPRSFCNGPYYLGFRKYILKRCALSAIHVFKKRNKAFAADGVLQENVIIKLKVGALQSKVKVSTSSDHSFDDKKEFFADFEQIVRPNDRDFFIHIPTQAGAASGVNDKFSCSLSDLGLECSTGPVVDFRAVKYLRKQHEPNSAPLLYPFHFEDSMLVWPSQRAKKANAIEICDETKKLLLPKGHYVVVRRFSSKEEHRRIHASVLDPSTLAGDLIGIENHLNFFHSKKLPIDIELCWGLAGYLISSQVDIAFRNFSGHTQVNSTDLRKLLYPTRNQLHQLGAELMRAGVINSKIADSLLAQL